MTAKPATTKVAKVAWENPLMPNARLRQIYLAMMQTRAFERTHPTRRGQRASGGLEACLVSPVVDLGSGDLVSDVLAGPTMEFLRSSTTSDRKNKQHLRADCGLAGRLPGTPGTSERIWTAVGAAAALQALAVRPKSEAGATAPVGVVLLYLLPDEIPSAPMRTLLSFTRDQNLPLLLVVLPPARPRGLAGSALQSGKLAKLALSCGVPVIPTDANDAVALYRVAQESVGHARIGGGPALIECIPCSLLETKPRRLAPADAISLLEQYMLPRNAVTSRWIDRQTQIFNRRLAKVTAASK